MACFQKGDSPDVNVLFLFGFAAGNALIDIICAALFFIRRDDVLKNYVAVDSKSGNSRNESLLKNQHMSDAEEGHSSSNIAVVSASNTNLNMASALTHVGGDTLRTGAVFVAAMVASLTDLNPTLCDAWAAVVVTITILFLVGPLLKEIGKAYTRLSTDKIILAAANAQGDVRESTY